MQAADTILKLTPQQRMFDDWFAERGSPLGIGIGVGERALSERYAAHAVRHTREVEHLENQIDSLLWLSEQPSFAVAELDLSSGNRAGGDLVFETANLIVELTVFSAPRHQVKTQAAYVLRCAFLPGRNYG